jgi:aminoglycoside phosphotransferase (APT) family kinase protein
MRQFHSFPIERATASGVPVEDGAALRISRTEFYENIVRHVFPLISCEARTHTEARFEAYLNDLANFDFQPRLVHNDLDRQNVIIDGETGHLTGIIDFDNVSVGKPAIDLWLPLLDFEKLGIADQLPAFLDAYADPELDLERARTEVEFIQFLWPFHDITFGLWTENRDLVQDGILALNASLPRDIACP